MASPSIIAEGADSVKEFDPLGFQTEFESLIRAIPYDGVADKLRHTLAEEIRGGVLSDGNSEPTLPGVELVEPSLNAGRWLTDYVDFAKEASPACPEIYHEALGIWCLSAAICRRVKLKISNKTIYPNLFFLIVDPPAFLHKTTAMSDAKGIMREAGIPLFPSMATPERLAIEMSTRQSSHIKRGSQEHIEWLQERAFAAQRSWWVNEAKGFFMAGSRDYLSQIRPIFLQLYDSPKELHLTATVSRGRATLKDVYVSFVGDTTPEAMRQYFGKNAVEWHDGTWSRFCLICHEHIPPFKFFSLKVDRPTRLIERLNFLHRGALSVPDVREVESGDEGEKQIVVSSLKEEVVLFSEGVFMAWENYARALHQVIVANYQYGSGRLAGMYGRLHISAIKVAMLLAAADWADNGGHDSITISLPHWHRALWITERWRKSLHRLESRVIGSAEDIKLETIQDKEDANAYRVLQFISDKKPNFVTNRELSRRFRLLDVKKVLNKLLAVGFIEETTSQNKRGPKSKAYRLKPAPEGSRPA